MSDQEPPFADPTSAPENATGSCPETSTETREVEALWHALGEVDEPGSAHDLRPRFNTMVDAYRQGLEEGRAEARASRREATPGSQTLLPWRSRPGSAGPRRRAAWPWATAAAVAASVVLAIGLARGPNAAAPTDEIAGLREEMAALSRTVTTTLMTHGSASERLSAVQIARAGVAEDDTILAALVEAVREDPSTSVRLAAIEALGPLVRERDAVRQTLADVLLATLSAESANGRGQASQPLVQIALVDTFLTAGEAGRRIVSQLKADATSEQLDPSVRAHLEYRLAADRVGASL